MKNPRNILITIEKVIYSLHNQFILNLFLNYPYFLLLNPSSINATANIIAKKKTAMIKLLAHAIG